MQKNDLTPGSLVAASLAGLMATVPMTATMLAVSRLLSRKREPLHEPRKITNVMLDRSNLDEADTVDDHRGSIQLAAHFAYGAGVGALYPAVEKLVPLPDKYLGPAFGCGVYAASYAGWLPALGILPAPQRRPIGRNVLLIAAHLVWGASLAATYRTLKRRGRPNRARRLSRSTGLSQREVAVRRHHMQRAS